MGIYYDRFVMFCLYHAFFLLLFSYCFFVFISLTTMYYLLDSGRFRRTCTLIGDGIICIALWLGGSYAIQNLFIKLLNCSLPVTGRASLDWMR